MVQFIDDHRAWLGVEPICAVLPIAPSTYHRHRHQRTDPTRRSARAQRDDQRRVEIQRGYDEHQQVYGPRKIWEQLRRDGVCVARCTVARLMRAMGLAGAAQVDRVKDARHPQQHPHGDRHLLRRAATTCLWVRLPAYSDRGLFDLAL